ncbi:hypothetical protein EIP86_009083 [Pleurotus ostreatoroseus]|nr:hypothetical protein EIP86_009083 [Pleurotus ostreatoroseus]
MIISHLFYELVLTDSSRVIALSHADHITAREAHAERRDGLYAAAQPAPGSPTSYDSKDKGHESRIETVEIADVV